ncbi:unnamed protein product, partial [marine sediment metagenome]
IPGRRVRAARLAPLLTTAKQLEETLLKLPGWSGVSYRGVLYKSVAARDAYYARFKVGQVFTMKAFQSTSRLRWRAVSFMRVPKESLLLHIKGKSGRSISKYAKYPKEQEVLFLKGSTFNVTKIKGNEIWLEEL